MRLSTIWTLRAMSTAERLRRTRDWGAAEIASHLPKRIRYFTALQMIGKATINSADVMATPLDEVLRNLETPKSLT